MSFRKNRKRSGLILTGVVLSSSAMSAVSQGMVSANETLGNLESISAGAAKSDLGNSGKVSTQGLPLKYVGYFLLIGITVFVLYKLYKHFISSIFVAINSGSKENKQNEVKDDNINGNVEYGMKSLFCSRENPKYFAKNVKKTLKFLANVSDDELLGIGCTKIKITVGELLAILEEGSKKSFMQAKGSKIDLKEEIEITIEVFSKDGFLTVSVESLEPTLNTHYIADNIDNLISFLNKVLKKSSCDNKKIYRFELEKKGNDDVFVRLIRNAGGEQVGNEFKIELDEKDYVKNEKEICSLILKYQYNGEKASILDKLFFESESDEDLFEKNFDFDFSKDLSFAENLELKVNSDTLWRMMDMDMDNFDDQKNKILDYLRENKNVKVKILKPEDSCYLGFKLYKKNGKDCFDDVLETNVVDNNVDKWIEFYNYILDEAYKQNKINLKVSLEKKEDGKIVVKHGGKEYEFGKGKSLEDILSDIKNDIEGNVKSIFSKGIQNIASLALKSDVGKMDKAKNKVILGEEKKAITIEKVNNVKKDKNVNKKDDSDFDFRGLFKAYRGIFKAYDDSDFDFRGLFD